MWPETFQQQTSRKLDKHIGGVEDSESDRVLCAGQIEIGFQAGYFSIA